MKRTVLIAGAIALVAGPAAAKSPLETALSLPRDAADAQAYAFKLDIKNGDIQAAMRFDPREAEGKRLTVLSPDEADWSKDFRRRVDAMQKDMRGDILCRRFLQHVPDTAEQISQSDTTTLYHFTPLPGEDDDLKQVARFLTGQVELDSTTGDVVNFTMEADKPFKPAPIAKVKHFKMNITCLPAPDGRAYVSQMKINMSGSAMLKSFEQNEVQLISDLQPVTLTE